MTNQNGDVYSLRTADGQEIFFDSQEFAWRDFGNLGAPPTDWITRRGYKQHGSTEIDYLLSARDIPIQLWRKSTPDRQTYWDNRQELIDFLRPNRTGPLTLTIRQPNEALRSILVRANPGLVFPPGGDSNDWMVDELVEFIAFNPIWFDYAATELAWSAATQTELVFPITFPISFGTSNQQFTTGNLVYEGTWYEYPIITLTGPYTTATITHQQTGVSVFLSVAIGASEQRIIDLTPGAQRVSDQNGNNRFAELGPLSNLVAFNLRPDPEIPDGIQEITATFVDGTGDSAASLTYRNRYLGI